MKSLTGKVETYGKVPKFSDAKKLCCNLRKIQTKAQTLGYFVKKMQMEYEGLFQKFMDKCKEINNNHWIRLKINVYTY